MKKHVSYFEDCRQTLRRFAEAGSLSDILEALGDVCGDQARIAAEQNQDANAAMRLERDAQRLYAYAHEMES